MKKPEFPDKYMTSQNWWTSVIDPLDCTKRYSVFYGNLSGGRFETFWFFRNAYKFAKSRYEDFVSISDEKNKTSLTIR